MDFWTIERDESIIIATFSNPPMGYFCAKAAQELGELLSGWEREEVRGVVLTGTGGKFITHYSVEELVAFGSDAGQMEATGTALSDGYHALLRRIAMLPAPVIAAIAGDCMGGGLELAMWCDIRVAELGDHRLGLPEIRLGIMPGGSGTRRLVELIGEAKARQMILLGHIVDPAAAADLGLVHYAVDDAREKALAIAHDFAALNPCALANIKRALVPENSIGLKAEAEAFLRTMGSKRALATMQHYLTIEEEDRRCFLETGLEAPCATGPRKDSE